jgi:plastocyanin
MKRFTWLPLVVAVAIGLFLGLTAPAGRATSQATARQAAASQTSQTFKVNVDGFNAKTNESFLGYFPRAVTVHAGDTVVFHYVGVGEPHTVTLGSLANSAVSAYNNLTPAQKNSPKPPASFLAIDATLPNLFPQGPGDAVASAANPCYMPTGLPGTALCPNSQHEQPVFDGTQSYYNSGWLKAKQRFTVRLASTTSAGTYRFMCLLHREGMSGKITVVPASKTILSPGAQYALGVKQLARQEAPLQQPAALLAQGKPPVPGLTLPGENPVLAGSGAPVGIGQIDEFGPKVIKIPVGGSVTWWLVGDHSITFNSDKTNNDIQYEAPDGTLHLNPKALAPAGGPGEPPPSHSTPPPPKHGVGFKLVASSSWDGQGFHNSGVFINSFPPVVEGYKLKFTHAGTYHYICVVHDRMKGTVIVGGS